MTARTDSTILCTSICILLIGIIHLSAQPAPISIHSRVDTTVATIGDRIGYRITLDYPPGTQFELPRLEESLGPFEILSQQLHPPRKVKERYRRLWEVSLTIFDTGRVEIPALEIRAKSPADSTTYLRYETDPQTIEVISVLPPGTSQPRDIKPPFPIRTVFPWDVAGFVGLLLAITGVGIWYYKRWSAQHPRVPFDESYLAPPYELAFRQLKALKEREYPTEEDQQWFYFRLSEILREYLERRYFIRAMEMTTREISAALEETDIGSEQKIGTGQLLQELDLIKFAKQLPQKRDMFVMWDRTYQLIDKTKREPFISRRTS